MPNWCENRVYIEAPEQEIINLKKAIADGNLLDYMVPQPTFEENANDTGMPTWWNWRVNNWGTKWEVSAQITGEAENSLYMWFDSAWSPPISAFRAWQEAGPDRSANIRYVEWGMMFCGEWQDGNGDYYNIPATVAEVEDMIPAELDEEFGISDMIAQWEDEIEEEGV